MYYNSKFDTGLSHERQDVVEIKLWGLYLLNNAGTLLTEIIESSLDHGPVEKNPQKPGRITLRFKAKEWESKVKKIFYNNRIPVIVTSSATSDSYAFKSEAQILV